MHSYLLGLEVYLSEYSSSSYFVYTSSKGSALTVFLSLCYSQGTKKFQYCTCSAGRVTYNFHSSCKHMHLPFFKCYCVCNKEHKGVICNMTSSSYSSQTGRVLWEELPTGRVLWEELPTGRVLWEELPTGRVLWEELLVLSRFHSLRADEWNFCPLYSSMQNVSKSHYLANLKISCMLLVFRQDFDGLEVYLTVIVRKMI